MSKTHVTVVAVAPRFQCDFIDVCPLLVINHITDIAIYGHTLGSSDFVEGRTAQHHMALMCKIPRFSAYPGNDTLVAADISASPLAKEASFPVAIS